MPLAVCKLKRLSALRLRPWICKPLTLNRPPSQLKARCSVQLQRRRGQTLIGKTLTGAAAHIAEDFALLHDRQRHPVLAQQRSKAPHVAEQV